MRIASLILALALALASAPAFAQSELAYRGRITFEATAIAVNRTSPLAPRDADSWSGTGLFVAAGDSTLDAAGRIRLAGGAAIVHQGTEGFELIAREAYVRVATAPWLDLEAGKRLLRWGVGYGFSPTGVLDPPRVPTDPNDRLGLNDGLVLARADVFRGSTSLTVAVAAPRAWREAEGAPAHMIAGRLRTIAGRGVEVALIAASTPADGPAWGANATHVIGDRLEWHAELLLHETRNLRTFADHRTYSAVLGLQYTLPAGPNIVLEYHRNGHGLDGDAWDAVRQGERDPGRAPSRRQFFFVRAARAGIDKAISPELIVLAGLDDGSWTVVPSIAWSPHARLGVYARVTRLAGGSRSVFGLAPWSTTMTTGISWRF